MWWFLFFSFKHISHLYFSRGRTKRFYSTWWEFSQIAKITAHELIIVCNTYEFEWHTLFVIPHILRRHLLPGIVGWVQQVGEVWTQVAEPAGSTQPSPHVYSSVLWKKKKKKKGTVHRRPGHDLEDLSVRTLGTLCSHVEPPCGMCGHAPAFQNCGNLRWVVLQASSSSPCPTMTLHIEQPHCFNLDSVTLKQPLKGDLTSSVTVTHPADLSVYKWDPRLPFIFEFSDQN